MRVVGYGRRAVARGMDKVLDRTWCKLVVWHQGVELCSMMQKRGTVTISPVAVPVVEAMILLLSQAHHNVKANALIQCPSCCK